MTSVRPRGGGPPDDDWSPRAVAAWAAAFGLATGVYFRRALEARAVFYAFDTAAQEYPLRTRFAREGGGWRWNPYINLGFPVVGEGLVAPFYPFHRPARSWKHPLRYNITMVGHYLAGGTFAYVAARGRGASRRGSLFAGATFMNSGFLVSFHDVKNIMLSAVWDPLITWGAEGVFTSGRRTRLAVGAAATGAQLSLGQVHQTVVVFLKIGVTMLDEARRSGEQLDPVLGKLTDPLTLNRYQYGNCDPANNVDPTGRSVGCILGSLFNPLSLGGAGAVFDGGLSIASAGGAAISYAGTTGVSTALGLAGGLPLLLAGAGLAAYGVGMALDECS